MHPAILACALWWNCQVSVLTYHNDLARTGENLNETVLTPANVSSGQFGRLFTYPVDGQIYGQPLYLPGVVVPHKGIHNIAFVATEHDSVYAFDADNDLGAPLWQVSFLNPTEGIAAASSTDLVCDSIAPEVGITATPVIDPSTGTLYVIAMTEDRSTGTYAHWLHALDVSTGAEKPGSPVEIQAQAPGAGDGNTTVEFKPWLYKERAGLLLLNGVVYTAWSSQCDSGNYHGWIIGYDDHTLRQAAVYLNTPNWEAGSFWQAGAAPAADSNGNIYAVSANGTFDGNKGGSDFGDSVVKLSTRAGLSISDYFAPYNAAALDVDDKDLGSSGAVLLPDEAGSSEHRHLLVLGSKLGTVYVLDRDNLGHFQLGSDSQIVQSLSGAVRPLFGVPTYFNNTVYFSAAHDQVKAFAVRNGVLSTAPISVSPETFTTLGTVPSISANGSSNGILWTVDPNGKLHAYDAADLSRELYHGSAGASVRFSTPTIANGKVYVGTANSLAVFGLQNPNPGVIAAVLTADTYQPGPFAPGAFIALFGSNLAPGNAVAPGADWPAVLNRTSAFINGVAAPLGYVSPTQINTQIPTGTTPGNATLTVVSAGQVLPPVELTIGAAGQLHERAK